jgi:sugar phosphate isomerase/epimerase
MERNIKKSVSLSLFRGKPESPILFRDDIEHTIPLVKDIGYDGVDLFVEDEQSDKTLRVVQLLQQHNLGIGVVMPAALAGMGLFLGDVNPVVRKETIRRMKGIIRFAGDIGGMVSLGLVRGSYFVGKESAETMLARFAASVEQLLPTAEAAGVPLLIEPINRYEINTLCSSMEAARFIWETKLPLGLMLDTFHMNIEDESICASFISCKDLVKHVHFVDSNRLAPSMGHLDMKGIFAVLVALGYQGYLCLEALDKPDGLTCAKKGIEFFASVGIR